MARVAEVVPVSGTDDWLSLAQEKEVDLTVVGPEAPLVAAVVDRFREAGLAIVGPTANAAQIEGSKAFAKDLMIRAGIPTGRHRTVTTVDEARRAIDEFGFPVVLKADGLAAGKGVVIAQGREEAESALPGLLGSRLVVEEFLQGEEVSFIVVSDGKRFLPFAPTQDHKAAYDGDLGPNTGGMGAYRDARILTEAQAREIERVVIQPAIGQMEAERRPFTGFLYAGLMMTPAGPRVLEFNARLGDPETQPLMHGLRTDLAHVLLAAANGDLSGAQPLEWSEGSSVCVVLAASGYPGRVRTGDSIHGVEAAEAEGAVVFQAGTRSGDKGLETAGGRVLGVTASGPDLRTAIDAAYSAARQIRFDGMHFRSDIGAKGLRRY
jgi:phosphoribosylamine--glycine ligase